METTWKSHTAKSFPRRLSVLLDNESIGAVRHCGLANNEIAVSLYYRKLSHGEDEMYDGVCFVDSPAQKRNGASIFINASPSLTYASYMLYLSSPHLVVSRARAVHATLRRCWTLGSRRECR